ncbi:hypothetical protein J5Y09_03505 [Roseomonas sp. PWR1]|uniref:FUSC family protein n=1 Tax=Roseomonas nitratireducens TaxID=2820810 RepID=A0ABS4ANN5_9PROT|nr:hypothetical protein [Neoroseomonas nitratireducens]MBP0462966.1 hypothetical protein [Neoroseomonas nitratireducens]
MISAFWRRWLLPFTVLPLLPATLFNLFAGREWALLGCVAGIALPMLATWLMRRGRRGDAQIAAVAMGGAAGIVTLLGAGAGPVAALLLAIGAWGGTSLLYTGVREVVPPPPPPAPPPLPEPLRQARHRLELLAARVPALPAPAMGGVLLALDGVLADLSLLPARLAEARPLIEMHLDGLERIADRLAAGAAPPPGLDRLLTEMAAEAEGLRASLRDRETMALAVQVKVLGDRLRQEGYG